MYLFCVPYWVFAIKRHGDKINYCASFSPFLCIYLFTFLITIYLQFILPHHWLLLSTAACVLLRADFRFDPENFTVIIITLKSCKKTAAAEEWQKRNWSDKLTNWLNLITLRPVQFFGHHRRHFPSLLVRFADIHLIGREFLSPSRFFASENHLNEISRRRKRK